LVHNSICFLKFVVYKIKFKIVKSVMVLLTGRENADVTNANVAIGWMLLTAAEALVDKSEKEN
jgi:hypothetical protein